VYRILRGFSPHIVHSWSVHNNAYAGLVGRLARIPICLGSLRGSIYLDGFRKATLLQRWLSLHTVSTVTVNARSIAEELRGIGYPSARVHFLPNCVEIPSPLPAPDLSVYGIDGHQTLIGTVGNLRRVKNQFMFIDALARVLPEFPHLRAVIVGQPISGEDGLQDQLQRHIHDLGLDGKIILLGFRDDVPALMARFSIFCLTSDSEGTPNTVLEAMAAGRPVVATRVGGVPDLIQDGVTGMLVDPGDHSALAARLIQLLENPEMAEQIGQTGMHVIKRDYSCQDAVDRLADLYQRALARDQSSSSSPTAERSH
jgi:glycosyltransferase involved in cell wall biosynthesis